MNIDTSSMANFKDCFGYYDHYHTTCRNCGAKRRCLSTLNSHTGDIVGQMIDAAVEMLNPAGEYPDVELPKGVFSVLLHGGYVLKQTPKPTPMSWGSLDLEEVGLDLTF